MKVEILLVKSECTRDFGFLSLEDNIKYNEKIFLKNYKQAFIMEYSEREVTTSFLEGIYSLFQNSNDTPSDYNKRSISMGDIVKVDNILYYVDMIGFTKLNNSIIG